MIYRAVNTGIVRVQPIAHSLADMIYRTHQGLSGHGLADKSHGADTGKRTTI